MARACFLGLPLIISIAGWTMAGPVPPLPEQRIEIGPMRVDSWVRKFQGGQRSWVASSGRGITSMGLYVFDEHGNCVARDDFAGLKVRDDLAVSWFVPFTGEYSVEVHNLSMGANRYDLIVK